MRNEDSQCRVEQGYIKTEALNFKTERIKLFDLEFLKTDNNSVKVIGGQGDS